MWSIDPPSGAHEPDRADELERIRQVYAVRDREIPREKYSVANPWVLLMEQQRQRHVVQLLRAAGLFPLTDIATLDVGSGYGGWLVNLESWGARQSNLAGIDLDEHRVKRASERLPLADIRLGDGASIPWADGSFDLVMQSTVFTSILDARVRLAVAREMVRVLRPGGAILWYDFFRDNPSNHDVRGIRKHEIEMLFPGFDVTLRRVTLAPPVSRWLAKLTWLGAVALESCLFLNTHYVGLLRRTSGIDGAAVKNAL